MHRFVVGALVALLAEFTSSVELHGAPVGRLILVRHGQSTWNSRNLFTGWADPSLTSQGRVEAARAGALLRMQNVRVDTALCSTLRRTSQSLGVMLRTLEQQPPIVRSWRLNEQHCGALTGCNKRELAIRFGEQQVKEWRRNPHSRPPAATDTLADHVMSLGVPIGRVEQRRSCSLTAPRCESMMDACARYRPLWSHAIAPLLRRGQTVLCCGHGNMLRGAVREIEGLSDEALMALELPQSVPVVYTFDSELQLLETHLPHAAHTFQAPGLQSVLLGDMESIRTAQQRSAAAHQGAHPALPVPETARNSCSA
jgi:2,3-bisphosphoglycerate-dependent phosphoglycerate mutase